MNTQKLPDFVVVGPTSDELVKDGYFKDVYEDNDVTGRAISGPHVVYP